MVPVYHTNAVAIRMRTMEITMQNQENTLK